LQNISLEKIIGLVNFLFNLNLLVFDHLSFVNCNCA
jgi:hypothetical protein